MCKRVLSFFVFFSYFLTAAMAQNGGSIPFADPFILQDNGKYYLYGTNTDLGIPVLVSDNLKEWSSPNGENLCLALNRDDSYGNYFFWAPEVYKVGDRYIMYYSSEEHICVAESDSPIGPFKQKEKKPILEEVGIDSHLFVDDDGKPYLFWVRYNNGNEIWVAELENNLAHVVPGTETLCIKTSQDWEKVWPSVNEGPFVVKNGNEYYLTYSANCYLSPSYGVGFAVAESVKGPWKKSENNPILQFYHGLEGVGHHALFNGNDGKKYIVFHSHNKPGTVHPRIAHIAEYFFDNSQIVVSQDFFTPTMK